MDAFELSQLIEQQQVSNTKVRSSERYLEFLRVPALSAGLYVLPAGGIDAQQPHTEDEVYYVVSGRGSIRVADEDRPVDVGSIIYAQAGVEHRFHSIAEALTLLVFFAPAEYSQA